MKRLTKYINEALGNILPREFMKIWKGQDVNIDDDHLKNASYVFTELMNVHRDKLPTTEEFTNMCRWFSDTYNDQPYVTEEYMEELLYRFFDTFVQRTQKRTFTKEIKHINYIDLGHDDLFKREISREYLTKTLRTDVEIDPSGSVKNFDGYKYDNITQDDMKRISSRLSSILYMNAYIKKRMPIPCSDSDLKIFEAPLKDFLKRWKISFEDFINKHDYSEGMRIMGKMFKK